jgi:hypothetical protein
MGVEVVTSTPPTVVVVNGSTSDAATADTAGASDTTAAVRTIEKNLFFIEFLSGREANDALDKSSPVFAA